MARGPEFEPLVVYVRDGDVSQAISRLKRMLAREGFFRDLKKRRFYEKPSEQRRRKQREAARRRRKKEAQARRR